MKRLYVVRVEVEYAVLADDEVDACGYVMDAIRDVAFIEDEAEAIEASRRNYATPDGWDGDTLVYGAADDTTWDEAVQAEQEADATAKRLADFAARQTSLPIE